MKSQVTNKPEDGNPNPWDTLTKALSLLAVCKISGLFDLASGKTSQGTSSDFSRKMLDKEVSPQKKATFMVDQALRTVSSGPTDAGYINLGVIVDSIVDQRIGELDTVSSAAIHVRCNSVDLSDHPAGVAPSGFVFLHCRPGQSL